MKVRQLTRSLERRLPAAWSPRLRAVALLWGRLTAGARMSPSIIVVGAQRSGTTTLFRLLEAHPQLVRPTLSKGTGYFDDHYDRGPRWYLAHFPLRALAALRHGTQVRAFECSGYYLLHPLAARRLAADLPDVHVVVLVRDPVERAASAHRHESARGFEDLSLADAVAAEPERTAGEEARLEAEPGYRSFEHRHHAYLRRGEYAAQVARFVEVLGEDRVHVVDADRFFARPEQEFTALQRRLDLPVWTPPSVERWNARPGDDLDDDLRRRLMHHFEPYDEALTALLGQAPSWRAAAQPSGRPTAEVAS